MSSHEHLVNDLRTHLEVLENTHKHEVTSLQSELAMQEERYERLEDRLATFTRLLDASYPEELRKVSSVWRAFSELGLRRAPTT